MGRHPLIPRPTRGRIAKRRPHGGRTAQARPNASASRCIIPGQARPRCSARGGMGRLWWWGRGLPMLSARA
eukprot:3898236-Alexandrium_andersonii.AAC.1